MNWGNWPSYANAVLQWVLAIIPQVFDMMLENPIVGVPVILGIVYVVFKIVTLFIGTISIAKSKKEE